MKFSNMQEFSTRILEELLRIADMQDRVYHVGMSLAENLKKFRKRAGLNGRQLAVKAEVSGAMISRIEGDEEYDPGIKALVRIAAALDITVSDLVGDNVVGDAETERIKAGKWDKFAKQFGAGDPDKFAETLVGLPDTDQAIVARFTRLMEMEPHIG